MGVRARLLLLVAGIAVVAALVGGCGTSENSPSRPSAQARGDASARATPPPRPAAATPTAASAPRPPAAPFPVMLGIDVLEAEGFAAVRGKKIGLLTHPAGVNRRGTPTLEVLRRAPGVQLVALYSVEHGIHGTLKASVPYQDHRDSVTGLPVFSLYNGKSRKATPQQLASIDALVIDLQDIGTRSYTFISAMQQALEACFENQKEVIVLDRPNPLGGLKVSGPPLDEQWVSYVGKFRVPYVHGLTMGELAKLAKEAPGVLKISDAARANGRLTIVTMRGWRRAMRWPETGLKFLPTSPMMPDFASAVGYPMTGLGAYLGGFRHGVGTQYPFRGLSHTTVKIEVIEQELRALQLPGLQFRRVSVTDAQGKPKTGLYIEVTDWDDWRPTELNFHLMRLACKLEKKNPFAAATRTDAELFLKHMGSTAFFEALKRDGARVDVRVWFEQWEVQARVYQQQSRKYWLYP